MKKEKKCGCACHENKLGKLYQGRREVVEEAIKAVSLIELKSSFDVKKEVVDFYKLAMEETRTVILQALKNLQ